MRKGEWRMEWRTKWRMEWRVKWRMERENGTGEWNGRMENEEQRIENENGVENGKWYLE